MRPRSLRRRIMVALATGIAVTSGASLLGGVVAYGLWEVLGPAHAAIKAGDDEIVCDQREALMRHLARQYGEHPRQLGLQEDGSVLEIVSSERGTWTMVVTQPSGRACAVRSGESWQAHPKVNAIGRRPA